MDWDLKRRLWAVGFLVAVVTVKNQWALAAEQVHEEIQVYNADIAEVPSLQDQRNYFHHLPLKGRIVVSS